MRLQPILLGLLVVSAGCACAQDSIQNPILTGYVTRAVSSDDFDVNGFRVVPAKEGAAYQRIPQSGEPYLGEPVDVFGSLHGKSHTVTATAIGLNPVKPEVGGRARILRVYQLRDPGMPSAKAMIGADGYRILIIPATRKDYRSPLTPASSISAGVWLTYKGRQRADGVVVAEHVEMSQTDITRSEAKFVGKNEYDPAKVNPSAKQTAMDKAFFGIDPKKIPPYQDPPMQARVESILHSLVPAYQRALPDGDPMKLNFRVQLVDRPKWRTVLELPSGILLLPKQVVERMQNDSQLAAILAYGVAGTLETVDWRRHGADTKITAAQLAGIAGGFFVPGLGLGSDVAGFSAGSAVQRSLEDQCFRVSLALMNTAGYDVRQAPVAWWLLASKKPKAVLAQVRLPREVGYLYRILGTTWREKASLPQLPSVPSP